jgi:hypothetical protein
VNPDRRQGITDRRIALRVPAVFAVKSFLKGRVQLGQAEDLGVGGMALRRLPDVPAIPGASISLTFALPLGGFADQLLRVQGVVVSDQLDGTFRRTGVRFAGLAHDTAEALSQFCKDQLDATGYGQAAAATASG